MALEWASPVTPRLHIASQPMKPGHTTHLRRSTTRALTAAGMALALGLTVVTQAEAALPVGLGLEGPSASAPAPPSPITAGSSAAGKQESDWSVVPLPTGTPSAPQHGALLDGRHLLAPGVSLRPATDLGPELPRRLAEEVAIGAANSVAGAKVVILNGSLFLRDPVEARDAAQGRLVALDAALAQLRFDVRVRLTTATAGSPPLIDDHRLVRSGGVAAFGRRERHAYVHGYGIEVATDVAIGAPEIGTALIGEMVHLYASTTIGDNGARQLFVQGLLDVSRLAAIETFDTEISALGDLELPAVDSVQVMFSGAVPTSGPLRLTVSGPTEATAGLVLEIEASPRRQGAADEGVVDLARGLWRAQVGKPHVLAADLPSSIRTGETPAGLAQLYARQFPRRSAASPMATDTLLLAPADTRVGARLLQRLSQALDPLSTPAAVSIAWEGFEAKLPTVDGALLRVARTRETTMVVGYEPQLANDAALCSPIVERLVTGTVIDAVLDGERMLGHGRRQFGRAERLHAPGTGDSGRLHLPVRSHLAFPLNAEAEREQHPATGVTLSWRSATDQDR